MPTKRKTPPKASQRRSVVSEDAVREIVDGLLRPAIREQSRAIEAHLNDIDRRLLTLEGK